MRESLTYLLVLSILFNSANLNATTGYWGTNTSQDYEDLESEDLESEDLDSEDQTFEVREIDTWSLIPQEATEHSKAGRMLAGNVVLNLVQGDKRYNKYDTILPKPLLFAPENPYIEFNASVFPNETHTQMELQYQGEPFWHYNKSVKTATRFGNYIVFIESEELELDPSKVTLSFIDLSYFRPTLGSKNGYIPVFKLDIPSNRPELKFSIQNSNLVVNEFHIPRKLLDDYSLLMVTTWNIQANLLTYETYSDHEALLETFLDDVNDLEEATSELFFSKISSADESKISSTKDRFQLAITAAQNRRYQNDLDALSASKDITDHFMIESEESKKRIENSVKTHVKGRSFWNKSMVLMERLKFPRPMAGGTMREAVGFTLGGLTKKGQRAWQLREGAGLILYNKTTLIGVPIASAVMLGMIYPTQGANFVFDVLDFGGAVRDYTSDKFFAWLNIIKEAFFANGTVRPQNLTVYFQDGVIDRFIIANIDILQKLLLAFAIPHLTVNAWYLRKDMLNDGILRKDPVFEEYTTLKQSGMSTTGAVFRAISNKGTAGLKSLVRSFRDSFVRIQDKEITKYFTEQVEDHIETNVDEFTNEQELEVTEIVQGLRKQEEGFIGSFLSNMKKRLKPLRERIPGSETASALRKFLFSWASLQKTYVAFTFIWWKYIFQARSYIPWKLPTASILFYYPNAFDVSIKNGFDTTSVHPITNFNGGKRPFWRQYPLALKSLVSKRHMEIYDAYREWETHILDVESLVLKKAQNKAMELTVRELELTSIKDISENALNYEMVNHLNRRQRTFYYKKFDFLFNYTMQTVLDPVFEEISIINGPGCRMSYDECLTKIDAYKPKTLTEVLKVNPSEEDIDKIIAEGLANEDSNQLTTYRNVDSNSAYSSVMNFTNRKLFSSMNPSKNKQANRWLMTKEQLADYGAKTRSTRKTFYKFIQRIPEFLIIWLSVSGIMKMAVEGRTSSNDIMVPLTDTAPYWSPYLFGMLFFADIIQMMMLDFGYTLQEEFKHNKAKFFDKSPPSDKNISFMRWYWEKMWSKTNTYLKNSGHYLNLIWSDIPSYTTMYVLISLITLKRIDLDPYILSYLMYIMFPTKGLTMKFDQGLEAAMAGYWYKDVPKKLRNHPLVQKYVSDKQNKARFIYQVMYFSIYTNLVSGTLSSIKLIAIDTSRELARLLFGFPPTVWAVKILNQARESIGFDRAIEFCQKLLTRGYDGWVPLSDGEIPNWLEPWKKASDNSQ